MAGVTEQSTFYKSTVMTLKGVYSASYDSVPEKYPLIFNKFEADAKRPFLTMLSYYGFGTFALRPEGQAPAIDQGGEGQAYTINYLSWALSYILTKEAQREDVYGIGAKMARLMAISMKTSKEYLISGILNFAFTAGVNLKDGVPLYSTAHPVTKPTVGLPTTFSNSLGATAPSPESYTQAQLLLELGVDERGMPMERTGKKLVFHPQLRKVWKEITGSAKAPYTNDNQINTVADEDMEMIPYRYLTNTLQWSLMAANGGLEGDTHSSGYSFKWDNEQWDYLDPQTKNIGMAAEFRLATGTWDPRGQVGSQGA